MAKHAPTIPMTRLQSCKRANAASPSRRGVLAAALALSTTAGASAILVADAALGREGQKAPHPDAAILAMEPELTRLIAARERCVAVEFAAEEEIFGIAKARLAERGQPDGNPWDVIRADAELHALCEEARSVSQDASRALHEAIDRLDPLRAVTIQGLIVKARVAAHYPDHLHSILDDLLAIDATMRA